MNRKMLIEKISFQFEYRDLCVIKTTKNPNIFLIRCGERKPSLNNAATRAEIRDGSGGQLPQPIRRAKTSLK